MLNQKKWKYNLVVSSIFTWLPFIYRYFASSMTMWGKVEFFTMLFLYIVSIVLAVVNIVIVYRKYLGKEVDIIFLSLVISSNLIYLGVSKIFFRMFVYIT